MGKVARKNKMDKIQILASLRDEKTNVKNLRKDGKIPAELYGHNVKNIHLAVNLNEFQKAYKKAGDSSIVEITMGDGKSHPAIIQEVQLHYLTNTPIHVDFYQVSMTEKLKAKVALEFTGEAPAIKTLGGVLVKVINEVEVQCLPADLPHKIAVDISSLSDFSKSIHIKDLNISEKVQVVSNPEEVVAKVQAPRDVEAELSKGAQDEKAVVEAVVAASEKPKPEKEEEKEEKPKKE